MAERWEHHTPKAKKKRLPYHKKHKKKAETVLDGVTGCFYSGGPEGLAAAVSQFDDAALRQPEVFGPALEPPADADEQTKLLAFTGRKAW
jgi:hypothetical protein